ncbi:pyridoxal phosphate-dependent decarboxylase family protein [Cryptosporangium phraense]|uniref:Aspartate aminotransferase family protein n=1 Tax=Cryptosporangium phraense TaxID=2593070 RepID=A0A545AUR4_9ACTN|nr:aminotransferase class V-fold PLP-dependent enzyme [Cryptosporangium phraense]TQS45077.1 aspartate aminotransferase family protein [Cryptosporangium phraense]
METDYSAALEVAVRHATEWLEGRRDRRIPPRAGVEELMRTFGGELSAQPVAARRVLDFLGRNAQPGLMDMQSGRFFGWVVGGTLPVALGADWLTSAWDQNTTLRSATPATAALEAVAAQWLLDLFGLPRDAHAGFVTGATMANFTGLAAARHHVLAERGWNLSEQGLAGAPPVRVLAGAERHDTVDLALRYLGLGRPTPVDADAQGRIRIDALSEALDEAGDRPIIVCLQAGNMHSGAFDSFAEAIAVAHARGAWVHVDGAFGLWAAASPRLRHLVRGVDAADSWATDAHKTLNVPYDCGVAIVSRRSAMQSAMGMNSSYLIDPARDDEPLDPLAAVPELSRRARGVPVWAALRALGRDGVAAQVDGLAGHARALARGIASLPGAEILNDVVFTQVSAAFEDDARTAAVTEALLAAGTTWMSGSRWHDRTVVRVSVSNWSTDDGDVAASLDAMRLALEATG